MTSNTHDSAHEPHELHRDPITGTPGAHPVGVGVGGAAGGAAAGAVAGTFMGPIGTLVGAAVGVVVGAAAGKGVAERLDPTQEHEYSRDAHADRPYTDAAYDYDKDYAPAYHHGLQGREMDRERSWKDAEPALKDGWEEARGESRLAWDDAREAVRDSWDRADRSHRVYEQSDRHYAGRFEKASYRSEDDKYGDFVPAYRYGTQARSQYADRPWDDELELELRSRWETTHGVGGLPWERARPAIQEAFEGYEAFNDNAGAAPERFKVD